MKNFIGSGKKFNDFVVKVTIDVEKATPFIYEYNGKKYLSFDLSTKREPDKFNKTHDASVWKPDVKEEPKNETPFDDSIPF